MISLETIGRLIDRKLRRLRLLFELVDSVEWVDVNTIRGKGLGDRDVAAERVGMYGFFSRAPDDGEALVLNLDGEGNSALVLGYRHRPSEPDCDKGEAGLADDQGQFVHIKRDGIYIDGTKLVLCGGGASIARFNDSVAPIAAMVSWMGQVTAAANAIAPGSVTPYADPAIGQISSGSTKVESG